MTTTFIAMAVVMVPMFQYFDANPWGLAQRRWSIGESRGRRQIQEWEGGGVSL